MPRDGSNVYSQPFPNVVDGTTIESAVYNGFTTDVTLDLNTPRPIVAGGTGATTAAGARDNIDAEVRGVEVTNYDSHAFEAGSFWSGTAATNPPVAGHGFIGIAYLLSDPKWLFVEARDLNDTIVPARKYTRYKNNNVWGPWSIDGASNFVELAGDVMTGSLFINTANPVLALDKTASLGTNMLLSRTAGVNRWGLQIGDAAPEAGSNTGSDFGIYRYLDDGVTSRKALTIDRATGSWLVEGRLTVGPWIGTGAGYGRLDIDCIAGAFNTAISFKNGGNTRWTQTCGGTGDNLIFDRFNDAGVAVDAPLSISRATGMTTFAQRVYFAGSTTNYWDTAGNILVSVNGYKPGGGAWVDSSDARIKTVSGPYTHGLAEILQVDPVVYTFNGNVSRQDPAMASKTPEGALMLDHHGVLGKDFIGVVAQDIETPLPETVVKISGWIDGQPVDDLRVFDPNALTYALVNAVKELAAKVETLTKASQEAMTRIEALEAG